MTDYVRDLLIARRQLGDGTYVFCSYGVTGHISGAGDWLKVLRDKTNLEFSLHDLRRTFITTAEALDISPYAIKGLVNHSLGNGVTEGYIKMTLERLRGPAQLVTDRLKQLCGVQPPSGNVQPLRASLPALA
jgi:hypothetical protein